jgi:glycosyltransferase involved in cell wall biosynthesis
MKILISNKYYYPRGGADIHSIELEELLKSKGHEVAFFSMQHPLNLNSEFKDLFPKEVDFGKKLKRNLISALIRPFGTNDVRRNFKRLLNTFKPDIVHLHNIHTQLSPVLAVIAHSQGIPVVWTLHDHKLVCPRYDCMRKGVPCELCFTERYNVLKYSCVKNSTLASIIAYLESLVWNKKVISGNTDLLICPSNFLLNNMIKGGYNISSLKHLPNFIQDQKLLPVQIEKGNYYCYIGRLSREKGIETLLKAAVRMPQIELKVIGTGPLDDYLKNNYQSPNISFLGFRKWEEIKEILGNAKCMVFPSECYENNPLSVIESLCLGTPVIGSRIAGIVELINHGKNGFFFEPGNVSDLQKQILKVFEKNSKFDYSEMAVNAREKFRAERFYEKLLDVYRGLLNGKQNKNFSLKSNQLT